MDLYLDYKLLIYILLETTVVVTRLRYTYGTFVYLTTRTRTPTTHTRVTVQS